MKYPHLAARIFNTPLLVHPGKLDAIIAGLGPRLLGVPDGMVSSAPAPEMFSTKRAERTDRGWSIAEGVAVLNVRGALVHRSRMDADSTMLLGYNHIAADVEDAMSHPDVHSIVMAWDSPGGEVDGAFELADRIFSYRGKKPIVSVVDTMAASAAYLSASATDEIVVTGTGYAGSIGVVMRHVDFSHALHAEGIKVTHIFAGSHKVDGNPYEPLPESVRADYQGEVDGLYGEFLRAVATHRGLTVDAVQATQARTYRGVAAIAARLADRTGSTDQVIEELAGQRTRIHPAGPVARQSSPVPFAQVSTAIDKGASMSGTRTEGGQDTAHTQNPTASSVDAATLETAKAAAYQAGVKSERERTAAILAHPAAAAHVPLAQQCICTGLSIEQATAVLGSASVAQGAGAAFTAAMGAMGNPAISGVERDTALEGDAALATQVLQAFRRAQNV